MLLSRNAARRFQQKVYQFFRKHQRDLPWRRSHDPYRILVSELMLQQTQVSRVLGKYRTFLKSFPTIHSLAQAPLRAVLIAWRGLGYNRRALMLHRCARIVVQTFKGKLPYDVEALKKLPGIGSATAGAIVAFALNKPTTFLETNIKTVFIHHFFQRRSRIRDSEILPLVQQTLDQRNPRKWYWALMDYGSFLKQTVGNENKRSTHYVRQSPLKGSNREVRGKIVRILIDEGRKTFKELVGKCGRDHLLVRVNLEKLISEGLVRVQAHHYKLP